MNETKNPQHFDYGRLITVHCGHGIDQISLNIPTLASDESKSSTLHLKFLDLHQQTPQTILGFYQTKEGFQPDFADFKHDYTQEFYQSYSFLSANVRGPVSFTVSASIQWQFIFQQLIKGTLNRYTAPKSTVLCEYSVTEVKWHRV